MVVLAAMIPPTTLHEEALVAVAEPTEIPVVAAAVAVIPAVPEGGMTKPVAMEAVAGHTIMVPTRMIPQV
jgi:hypothetical protein